MRVLQATVAFAVVLGLAGAASAQSLGELAEKEKQKRQGKPAPKTITEADLARAGKRGTLSMAGSPEEPAAPAEGAAEGAATAEGAEATEGEGAEGAAPAQQKPAEPAKPKGPPPKSEEEIRGEKKAEMQKKLDLAQQNLATHRALLDKIVAALNSTVGTYSPERADAIKRQGEEKAAVAKFQAEIAQIEEDIRRSAWAR